MTAAERRRRRHLIDAADAEKNRSARRRRRSKSPGAPPPKEWRRRRALGTVIWWAIPKISSTISIEQKYRDTRYYRDTDTDRQRRKEGDKGGHAPPSGNSHAGNFFRGFRLMYYCNNSMSSVSGPIWGLRSQTLPWLCLPSGVFPRPMFCPTK